MAITTQYTYDKNIHVVSRTDANGDGRIDNYVDTDNDGFNDVVDGDVGNNGVAENTAGALVLTGTDTNSDGLPNSYPQGVNNIDGNGLPNFLDLDADNDGIADIIEVGGVDANNDGRVDGYTDTDGDGWSQNGNVYSHEGDGPTLTIVINMGAGSVTLKE